MGERLALLLDNARLYEQAQSDLRELSEERDLRARFVSTLAHDLRGPLTVAAISAQLLSERPDGVEEHRHLAAKVVESIKRADQMIRDLLDFNRIRAGQRLPLTLDLCDLGTMARQVADELTLCHGSPRFGSTWRTASRGYGAPSRCAAPCGTSQPMRSSIDPPPGRSRSK